MTSGGIFPDISSPAVGAAAARAAAVPRQALLHLPRLALVLPLGRTPLLK